jgi:hypothetical protein
MEAKISPQGIAKFCRNSNFEIILYRALQKVPSEIELEKIYGDKGDRLRARRRLLISVALDALFFSDIFQHDGEINIEDIDPFSDLLSDLAIARRDFIHDCDRLNNGIIAETILTPSKKASTNVKNVIKADRQILIMALVAIDLGTDHVDPKKKKPAARIRMMAKIVGYTEATLSQYRKQMEQSIKQLGVKNIKEKPEFSEAECDFFLNLLNQFSDSKVESGRVMDDLVPAISALRQNRAPKQKPKASDL